MKIYPFGSAPQAVEEGFKLVSTVHGTEQSVTVGLAEEDIIFVKGAMLAGRHGHFEFARFERDAGKLSMSIRPIDALVDPEYRKQVQGLMDVTAALRGEPTSPVIFSTDAESVLNRKMSNVDLAPLTAVRSSKLNLQASKIPGVKATVVESCVSQLRRELSYDIFLPSSHGPMFAADVAPSLTPDGVLKLLSDLANKAATSKSN